MVFYLKYRPQKIEDLDSKSLREKLSAVLSGIDVSSDDPRLSSSPRLGFGQPRRVKAGEAGKRTPSSVPHAFLFTGPKGLGKTSTARIVAKIVNCEKKLKVESGKLKNNSQFSTLNSQLKNIEPCNKCNQCVSITNGSNIDVLEIDGASNRGIDEIRDLREKIRLAPAKAVKKIYIIDEVHMFTTEAFNALLKTLEEPPSHAMFVFCTTESHKVPETILSRCFHVPFSKATEEELVSSFRRIIEGENLKVDGDALVHIARLSDGSFRDGAKTLQEVSLLAKGNKITKELVEKEYQISDIKYQISEMLKLLADRNTKETLKLISELVKQGKDIRYFVEQLISELHEMILGIVGVKKWKVESGKLKMEIEDIKRLIEFLSKAHGEVKHAVLPQLPLELAVIEFTTDSSLGVLPSLHPASVPSSFAASSAGADEVRAVGRPSARSPLASVSHQPESDIWKRLIEQVKAYNHSIAGVLRGCSLKSYNGKELVIETAYKFHKEKLDEEKARMILEKASEEINGNKVQVFVELKAKQ